jgi:hypothetical protein
MTDLKNPELLIDIADEAWLQALAATAKRALLASANHFFGATTSGPISNVAQTVLAEASGFTPKVSGKVLVQFECVVANGAVSSTGFTPAIGHALHGGTVVADTIAAAATPIAGSSDGPIAFQWVLLGLVVGTSYDIAAMAQASQVGANVADCRLYVQELAG